MTWTITFDWPDYRDHHEGREGHMRSKPPKDGRRRTLSFDGTFSIYASPVVVGTGKTGQDKWICREATRQRIIHIIGTSSNPLPGHREWPRHFWDDINITLTRDDQPLSMQLSDPTVAVVDQDGDRFVLCIYGTQMKPNRQVLASQLSTVFCMVCGGYEIPGMVVQGARGDVIALCEDCRTKIGGCACEAGKAVNL